MKRDVSDVQCNSSDKNPPKVGEDIVPSVPSNTDKAYTQPEIRFNSLKIKFIVIAKNNQ